MKKLKDKVLSEGRVLKGSILKVDSFLNHQVDVELMKEVGEVFAEEFKDKMTAFENNLVEMFAESAELEKKIQENLKKLKME